MSSEEGDEDTVGALAEWVRGAPQEQRDAHYRAQRWAHVLGWQVGRLHAARRQALESFEAMHAIGFYPDKARWPFMEMDAEAHFTLVARQLVRALRAFDGQDRLPDTLSNSTLRDLRDALEHLDAPGGSEAAKRRQTRGLDPFAHTWSRGGPGVLGKIVSDAVLQQWANDVYEILSNWDPYDGGKTSPRPCLNAMTSASLRTRVTVPVASGTSRNLTAADQDAHGSRCKTGPVNRAPPQPASSVEKRRLQPSVTHGSMAAWAPHPQAQP